MPLITDDQRAAMLAHGSARARGATIDPHPVVKLHALDAGAVWLLTELDADGDRAYGLCDAGTGSPELGYVSLKALEAMKGPRGMPVVADPHFRPRQSLATYAAEAEREGSLRD